MTSTYQTFHTRAHRLCATLAKIEHKINLQYRDKLRYIQSQISVLSNNLSKSQYYNDSNGIQSPVKSHLKAFINNDYNVDTTSFTYHLINDIESRKDWLTKLHNAIVTHSTTPKAWSKLFK